MRTQSEQRVLVTGGTSGIGEAVVRRLRTDGARVVFTGRNHERGARVAEATGAVFVAADARDAAAVTSSVSETLRLLGGLDAAVLNAGVLLDEPLSKTTDEAWDGVMETNLIAPLRYARATLPALRASRGTIILTASDAGVVGETTIGAYSVAKRALIMLARMLAVEAGPDGVRTNAVCPGDTEPGMVTLVDGRDPLPDTDEWTRPPLGRLVTAADVAGAVAFLASADAVMINGVDLLIDGGMRAALRAGSAFAERSA